MAASEIIKTDDHELVAGSGEGLCSFFVPGEIDKAFRENSFSVSEMITVLCDIVREQDMKIITKRDGTVIEEPLVTPKEKMAALKMLDGKAKEGMILGGLIQNDRLELKRTLADGTVAEYSQDGMRLVKAGSDRLKSTLALLERARDSKDDDIIDVEEVTNDTGNGTSNGPGDSSESIGLGTGTNDGGVSGHAGSGGDGLLTEIHGGQRSDKTASHRSGEDDDQETIGGTEDERSSRIPGTDGGGREGQGTGSDGTGDEGRDSRDSESLARGTDCGPDRRPVTIGGDALSRLHDYSVGIPRRTADSSPASDVTVAEAIEDRLARIERAKGNIEGWSDDNSSTTEPGSGKRIGHPGTANGPSGG